MRRKVTRVIDGDTFEVATKIGDTNRVRIAGYSAPELNESGGKKAAKELKNLIGGETVSLIPRARSYDRIVADVRIDKKKVSKIMKK